MSVLQIQEQEWKRIFKNGYPSMFFNPNYLNILNKSFGYELSYYVYLKGERLLFGAAIFSHGNKVVVPDGFTYASIYVDDHLGDIRYTEIFGQFLILLTRDFKKVSFRLSPKIVDIRPFIWAGFSVGNRYTYLRDASLPLDSKILKGFSELNSLHQFSVKDLDEVNLKICLDECFRYEMSNKYYEQYKAWFSSLAAHNYLKCFAVMTGTKQEVVQFAILDVVESRLYTILIADFSGRQLTAYLNKELYSWCVKNNIEIVDMIGANNKNIANFKCSFNAELTPYYSVHYNRSNHFLRSLLMRVKVWVKKSFRW
jgi:hypothetical protein